ncbi:Uncharacterised protein [Shigella sonnei]|nr:Uncharacterised protein [Shigella sonnei]
MGFTGKKAAAFRFTETVPDGARVCTMETFRLVMTPTY